MSLLLPTVSTNADQWITYR